MSKESVSGEHCFCAMAISAASPGSLASWRDGLLGRKADYFPHAWWLVVRNRTMTPRSTPSDRAGTSALMH